MPKDFSVETGQEGGVNSFLNYPKCKKRNTRKRAFDLLVEYCKNQEKNFEILLQLISQHHEKVGAGSITDIDTMYGSSEFRPAHGFVGLRNLHSTCYINSLVQQLSNIEEIRRRILDADIAISFTNINPTTNEPEKSTSIIRPDELPSGDANTGLHLLNK